MGKGLWDKILGYMGLAETEDEDKPEEIENAYAVPKRKGKVLDIRTAS